MRDSRRCIAYTQRVPQQANTVADPKASSPLTLPGRRRSATGREQARRKAWGQTWGKVGADYKQQRLAKEA